MILLIGVICSILTKSFVPLSINGIIGIFAFLLGSWQKFKPQQITTSFIITPEKGENYLASWEKVNGKIPKLLPIPSQESNQGEIKPEITNYSFDRVIVCDTATLAQFLIANNFHFENNCAVLSITGYPEGIFATVLQMLRQNPNLKVYALHDASPLGVTLAYTLRTNPDWFADSSVTIYDIGLLPKQVLKNPYLFVTSSPNLATEAKELPREVKSQLSEEELNWLEAGNLIELESLNPKKLLQIINLAIKGTGSLNQADLVLLDYNSEAYIYTSDSFG
jgi:hypothetical protein